MGNASRKLGDIPDEHSGMTEQQMKLLKDTWHKFCDNNREYGVLLFLSLFIKHPELLSMFRHFKGKPVSALMDDPMFRAHGCAIGYHITALVDSLGDPAKFEILARQNAREHLKRKGVKPAHFEVMGEVMVGVLKAKEERSMTPAAVEAWEKFLMVSCVLEQKERLCQVWLR
ncbi:hypothetical protein HPB48_006295 [Haemaphysalis longicornis]|uniref:Globin domain-containing protein n=1 Tax=Haemaphysalis longicornis TaxID=44386 RepID=A0A9J6GPA9_HAELO|nr:hypothetical protein HPB48_006295 [Haemaphysalis longicornis]